MTEGNDDNSHIPERRSLKDLFEAFGDSEKSFRERVEGGDGGEEEEIEETEEEKLDREERERIAALNKAGVSHVLGVGERQKQIIEDMYRADRLKDEDGKEGKDDE